MKVLLINQCFHPDVVATAQHLWDLARHLVRAGHEVTVITSRSLYGSAGATLPPREHIEGITVIRVGSSRFGKSSLVARAADFAGFLLRAAIEALRLPRQDVSVVLTTPPFVALVGVLLQALRGTRMVYWVMDLYPDVPIAAGVLRRGSLAARLLEGLHRACLKRSTRVVALGRCMSALIASKGVEPGRIRLIRPWAEPGTAVMPRGTPNRYREEWKAGDRILVMYSGNFGLGHDFGTFIEGAIMLRDDDRFLFALVGGGKQKRHVVDSLRSGGVSNVIEAPYQPRESLGELLAAADIHLVSLSKGWAGVMVPSKFFGIAGAGRGVLCMSDGSGEIDRCITESGCGIVIEPGDARAFREALVRVAEDRSTLDRFGTRAAQWAADQWAASTSLEAWRTMIEELAAPSE